MVYTECRIRNYRIFGLVIQIKTPTDRPLFSERYGHKRPILKIFGYRVFVLK